VSRVRIAAPTPQDQRDFLAMTRASREFHRPWVHPPQDAAGFAELLGRARGPDTEALLARRREDDALVGVFVLSQIFRRAFQSAYLGYYASAEHAGQAYMSEALGLVLDDAFGRLRLHRVEANIQPGNTASLALVQRCGFRREGFSPRYLKIGGRWRDHERWAILAEDWRGRGSRVTRSAREGSAAP
jgi:ribosomal-protein-alanine N-acetyltransferase